MKVLLEKVPVKGKVRVNWCRVTLYTTHPSDTQRVYEYPTEYLMDVLNEKAFGTKINWGLASWNPKANPYFAQLVVGELVRSKIAPATDFAGGGKGAWRFSIVSMQKRLRQVRDALNKCADPEKVEEIGRLLGV